MRIITMRRIRIGVLGPSEIAFRRTVPAIINSNSAEFAGIAHASLEEYPTQSASHAAKCDKFAEAYGGMIYDSFGSMIEDDSIDAVYIPLPPDAHGRWARAAMAAGKHVMLEKPSTTSAKETEELAGIAADSGLALHENYAYAYHMQIGVLEDIASSGRIGELRLIRATFSFPYRGADDFRYHADRGGGAIIDCGGYPVNLASRFLGESAHVTSSVMGTSRGHDVDTYGAAMLEGESGLTAQISWGMDNAYRCSIELCGSTGMAATERVFTPPAEMEPVITIRDNSGIEEIVVSADDQFARSVDYFCDCIADPDLRARRYDEIIRQARLVQEIIDNK